jgi:galactokinase
MTNELIKQIQERFETTFNKEPLTINSPGRINLIGEHTDYNNGFVLPAAIDKGIITAIQKSNNNFCTAVALDLDETYDFSLNEIIPLEKGGWKNYIIGVAAEIQKYGKTITSFNMVFGGDIPNGAGLSSSAAIENGLVFGLNELFNLGLSKKEMILISQQAEHNFALVNCGIMDQFASMFGKKDTALLLDCNSFESSEFKIDFDKYQLLLINTNIKHSLSESAYNDRRSVCEYAAKLADQKTLRDVPKDFLNELKTKINDADYKKVIYVFEENDRVKNAIEAIKNNDMQSLGKLLYASHNGLQNMYKVSCNELDFLVDYTRNKPSVIGARMMGGGFGGCTINLIEKNAVPSFSKKVIEAYSKQFHKECSIYDIALSEGTHIHKN